MDRLAEAMLAFLTDNYEMLPNWNKTPQVYDTPHQIDYIEVLDPSRWLYTTAPNVQRPISLDGFWNLQAPAALAYSNTGRHTALGGGPYQRSYAH